MNISGEQLEILKHTKRNRRYCGRDANVTKLVELGLLESCGFVSWCPDEYFSLTKNGNRAIEHRNDAAEGP